MNANKINGLQWWFINRMADSIVACSHALAREIISFNPGLKHKVKVVQNGFDPGDLMGKLKGGQSVHNSDRPFIINIGTYEYKKGQDVLIRSFANVKDRRNYDLVFIGRTESRLKYLKKMVADEGLQDRVFFYENIDHKDVIATLSKASIFALPSRIEPFGIVIFGGRFLRGACYREQDRRYC